jgi:hypothetical protein
MNLQVDDKSLITALTNGIGAVLGRRARSSFFELARRLPGVPEFNGLEVSSQQQIVDILALAVFYDTVVFPLKGGMAFQEIAKRAGVTHVRIGRDKLTDKFSRNMQLCVNDFHVLLRHVEVPVDLLSFATLSNFVRGVIALAEQRENEALDRQKDPGD